MTKTGNSPSKTSRSNPKLDWEDDAGKLVVGIEQEHFLFHSSGRTPALSEMKNVFSRLVASGYRASSFDVDGMPLSVNLDTESGYISIKNDLCTHIIEVAFPPIRTPKELKNLYESVWEDLRDACGCEGLLIQLGGSLAKSPEDIWILQNHPRFDWFAFRDLPLSDSEGIFRFFTALMCATQVHLNINNREIYSRLPALYACEFIVPLLFANSPEFNGFKASCTRPIAWRSNLEREYLANAFPNTVPNTRDLYQKMLRDSQGFQRDFSFISPRDYGSVEFRSGCSQNSLAKILEMVALRMAILIFAVDPASHLLNPHSEDFYRTCHTGEVVSKDQASIIRKLLDFKPKLTNGWEAYLKPSLDALENLKSWKK